MNIDKDRDSNRTDHGVQEKTLNQQLTHSYNELAAKARNLLRQERAGHTLQTSALVHEAYLRMIKLYNIDWKDQSQFLPATIGVMRRVLVDHARSNNAKKRGGELQRVDYNEDLALEKESVDIEALDTALLKLAEQDPLQASIVEHRYFGGMTIQQTGTVLGMSPATVKRKWLLAQAWLYKELRVS